MVQTRKVAAVVVVVAVARATFVARILFVDAFVRAY